MEYMLIFLNPRGVERDPSVYAEMGKFAGELNAKGKLKSGAPLHDDAEGARVSARGGKRVVTDGPFTETKEVIGGFFIVDCDSREEAIALAERCPHSLRGITEVRKVMKVGPM